MGLDLRARGGGLAISRPDGGPLTYRVFISAPRFPLRFFWRGALELCVTPASRRPIDLARTHCRIFWPFLRIWFYVINSEPLRSIPTLLESQRRRQEVRRRAKRRPLERSSLDLLPGIICAYRQGLVR